MCPIVFEYGAFKVSGYWLFMAMGLLACYIYLTVANKRLKGERIPWYHRNNLFCLCMISIFVGGALMGFFVNLPELIENWDYYGQSFSLIWEKAFSDRAFYGGAIMLGLTLWWYVKHYGLDGETVSEIFVPGAALFMFFSRIGCFMGGCCYGVEVSWGVIFPEGSLAPAGIPLFPSQLAESAGHLILFFALLAIKNKVRKKYDLIFIYTGAYSLMRFILEFFRGDAERGIWWAFSTSQWISLILAVIVIIYIINSFKRKEENYEKA